MSTLEIIALASVTAVAVPLLGSYVVELWVRWPKRNSSRCPHYRSQVLTFYAATGYNGHVKSGKAKVRCMDCGRVILADARCYASGAVVWKEKL